MRPRLVERPAAKVPETGWHRSRYRCYWMSPRDPVETGYRVEPAASVMYGPLLLAKSRLLGEREATLADPFTVNGKGYSLKVSPLPAEETWGAWEVELSKPGEKPLKYRACDFSSAADRIYGQGANVFSTRF